MKTIIQTKDYTIHMAEHIDRATITKHGSAYAMWFSGCDFLHLERIIKTFTGDWLNPAIESFYDHHAAKLGPPPADQDSTTYDLSPIHHTFHQ